ncbi:hypothetical protein [Microbacterium sp. P5_E9]
MPEASETSRGGASRLTRRQVMRAAAWGAPVVVAALAAPAAVASVTPPADARVEVTAITATGRGTVFRAKPPVPWDITVTVFNHYTAALTVTIELTIPNKCFFVDENGDPIPAGIGGTFTQIVQPGSTDITGFAGLLKANNSRDTLTATPLKTNPADPEWTGLPLTVFIKPGHQIPYAQGRKN